MDWTEFIFGKKALKKAAQVGDQPTNQEASSPNTLNIAKMAQDQADDNKAKQFTGAHMPTIQQLQGVGTGSMPKAGTCPMCGK